MLRVANIIFCVIWLFFAGAFAKFSWDAKLAEHTKLERIPLDLPEQPLDWAFWPGKITLSEVVRLIYKTNNENITELEKSIQESARTSFRINSISCFFALLGFFAQLILHPWTKIRHNDEHEDRMIKNKLDGCPKERETEIDNGGESRST